jgi:hypothetical protein
VEKLVYLLWQPDGASIEELRERMLGEQAPRLLELTRGELTALVADVEAGPGVPVRARTEWPDLAAAVSLWLDSVDGRAPIEESLRKLSCELAGYLVTESVPLEYTERGWPDGTRSPGVTILACFEKPERLSDAAFIEHWHGSHTPKSLEIHPLRRYIRNVVARPLTAGAPAFRGIVPEAFDSLDDFVDPQRLYGSTENMKRMIEDQQAFLDLARVHWTATGEYILRGWPGLSPPGPRG